MGDTLNCEQVAVRFGVCLETIMRWRRAGMFPAPVVLPGRKVVWRDSDLAAFEQGKEIDVAKEEAVDHARSGLEELVKGVDHAWTADLPERPAERCTMIMLIQDVPLKDGVVLPVGMPMSHVPISVAKELIEKGLARPLLDPRWVHAKRKGGE